jgi:serine protease inhibitor
MGMPIAFSNAADFSAITKRKEGLKLSGIIHKTIVKVNEWGTEAAAVSGVYGVPGGIAIERITAFRADHPFMFLIMDRGTNSILFMGRVFNPKS